MIPAHAEIYRSLTPVETLALWTELYRSSLVSDPPDPTVPDGSVLAEKCSMLSHAEVVLSVAHRPEKFWYSVVEKLIRRPVYMCARGETSIPLTDYEGRPLPLPIGHRRGEPVGSHPIPARVRKRFQYRTTVDGRVIVLLVDTNPKQPRSKSYSRFALYATGMTVSEYVAIGGHRSDIPFDVSRGYIRVDLP